MLTRKFLRINKTRNKHQKASISQTQYTKLYNKLNKNGTFRKIDNIMSSPIDDRIIRARKLLEILDTNRGIDREMCLVYILKSNGDYIYSIQATDS